MADRTKNSEGEKDKKSSCFLGCLVLVGVLVIVIATGIFAFHKITSEAFETFDEDIAKLMPEGYETRDLYEAVWDLIKGVVSGEIEPERMMWVSSALVFSMMDGVLTYEELSNIIGLIYNIEGMRI
jgi:hypothetical protein